MSGICIECSRTFLMDPSKVWIVIGSILISLLFLFAYNKFKHLSVSKRVSFLFLHLFFLIFPAVFYYAYRGCVSLFVNCSGWHKFSVLMTFTLLGTSILALIVAPLLSVANFNTIDKKVKKQKGNKINSIHNKKYKLIDFIDKQLLDRKDRGIEVRILDSAKPIAFSMTFIKKIVFLSVGLFEILNKKEREAVILHELGHIKSKSSLLKFSASIFRFLSPFSIFASFKQDLDKEEEKADNYAIKVQKTNKHIESARDKIEEYNNF